MLPGQWGLLIIGIASALALGVLGVFSYLAYSKEKRQKEKEARARRREQWHESLTATADDDLSGAFEETAEMPATEQAEITPDIDIAEDEFVKDFDPFAMPETQPQAEEPAPKAPEKRGSTRNDFDFKF